MLLSGRVARTLAPLTLSAVLALGVSTLAVQIAADAGGRVFAVTSGAASVAT